MRIHVDKKIKFETNNNRERFDSFDINIDSELYDFATIVNELIRQEVLYCNSDYVELIGENKNFEIRKFQTGDDNKIYDVKDTSTGKTIRFAVRSCVLTTPT